MKEFRNPRVFNTEGGRRWLTSPEAEAAYTYVPAGSEIPDIYAQDGKGDDAIVYIKLFDPMGSWTWYLTEFNGEGTPEPGLAFGLVDGAEVEMGYIDLEELAAIGGKGFRLPIERDIHFTPTTLGEVRRLVAKRRGVAS